MTLMRSFSKVDKEGKISIPSNIRQEVGLKECHLVEIKVNGTKQAQYIIIHQRKQAR